MNLKERIQADVKAAMKAGDKPRREAIRLVLAAIKQREVDERITLDNQQVLAVLDKMVKQRRESLEHFRRADRDDLVQRETDELAVIQCYLPEALSDLEIANLIKAALDQAGAVSLRDMGAVMKILQPAVQGRADMAAVSAQVKALLSR